jgi:alcohol dehydrogenase, propanol-preferring
MMKMMKALQIPSKGEKMKLVEVPVPQPREGQVLLRVEACGVCNGDSRTIRGGAPDAFQKQKTFYLRSIVKQS